MKRTILFALSGIWLTLLTISCYSQSLTDTIFDRNANEAFAFGADISWGGSNLKDKNGIQKDLLTILKEQGLNSVRYRVWYPDNGPSGKNEVVRNAKEAHDKGFRVMIDFHYSDSWADPGKQYKPSAWEGHSIDQLVQDVYDHTYDVLSALKDVGVTPEWVQIGNETKRGMLWPDGNTNDTPGGMDNFARMIKSGYDAIKDVDSTIQAIVHLPDADENSLYRWMFDALKNRGVKWDIIGMSAYPRWAHLDWETEINLSVANMKDMIARYDTEVMIVETGHYWYEPYISNNFLVELMDTMLTFGGLGCFFWEPQSMFGYELTAWDPATRQPTIAMDAYLGIKHLNPTTLMNINLNQPTSGQVFEPEESITLSATASHVSEEIVKVSFYLDDKLLTELDKEPYEYVLTNPGVGNHSIYSTATDINGIEVQSETIWIQIGIATIIQENENGYCGIKDNAGSVDVNHQNYTGSGFINTDNETGATINWTINFPLNDTYKIEIRYAGLSDRPGKLTINAEEIGLFPFNSTGSWDEWEFSSINYTVSKAGAIPIAITATGVEGLPNIDYMIIRPVNSSTKVEPALTCLDQPVITFSNSSIDANDLIIYPVPKNKRIVVKSPEKIDNVFIFKVDGTKVKSITNIDCNQTEISYSELNSGLYIIQTKIKGITHSRKLILSE